MSEEDILEIIEELQCEYKEQENENKYNDYTVYKAKRYSKGLQGLLDLYKKEKEKNKELLSKSGIYEIGIDFGNDYISKDKLKEFFIDKITYRQFELQQEYKDFKDDIKLNTLQDIKEELLEE